MHSSNIIHISSSRPFIAFKEFLFIEPEPNPDSACPGLQHDTGFSDVYQCSCFDLTLHPGAKRAKVSDGRDLVGILEEIETGLAAISNRNIL